MIDNSEGRIGKPERNLESFTHKSFNIHKSEINNKKLPRKFPLPDVARERRWTFRLTRCFADSKEFWEFFSFAFSFQAIKDPRCTRIAAKKLIEITNVHSNSSMLCLQMPQKPRRLEYIKANE